MRTSAKTACGLAILVLMLTGTVSNSQTLNRKSAHSTVGSSTGQPSNQKQTKSTGGMQNAQSNPMYKENKTEGTNPLFEHGSEASKNGGSNSAPTMGASAPQNAQVPKTSTTTNPPNQGLPDDNDPARHHPTENKSGTVQPPANNASHGTVEYEDPEDMTTRYRPGNNKTTKTGTPVGPPSSPSVVEYKDGEDGTTQTRPNNPK